MRWLGAEAALSRLTLVAILSAGFGLTAVTVQAQDAPAPAQEAAPPPQDDPFLFSSEAALIIWYVKPEATAGFERVWGSIRGQLAASDDAELKALGSSLTIFRAPGDPTPQGVTYFFFVNPASRTKSYSPSPFLLFEAGLFEHEEATELFGLLSDAINNINPLPLNRAAAPIAAPAAAPAAP